MTKNDTLHLAGVYTKIIMRSWFQYKVDAILRSLAVFIDEIRYTKRLEYSGDALFVQPAIFDLWYFNCVFYRPS